MADFNEEIDLNFKTNAKSVQGSVDGLNVSIDKTTKSTKANNAEVERQEESYKSFKTQLREANQELLKMAQTYGETSKEAVTAAKKVAELKDQIGFAKDLSDSFNPDQKFKALGAATNIAATSMTGITGAMGLFGDQSEDTEKMLLKVQSAMAFSQAISGLSDLGDQFALLRTTVVASYNGLFAAKTADTIATEANAVAENQSFLAKAKNVVVNGALAVSTGVVSAAQWVWNTALYANPVVAVALAIVALVAGLAFLTKALIESSAENERAAKANAKLSSEVDRLKSASEKSNKQLEINNAQTLAMAKASGKSAEEIRKLAMELANQEVVEKKLNATKAYSIVLEAQRVAGLEDATDAQKETFKKAAEYYNSQNQQLRKAFDDRAQLRRDNEVAERQEQTDAYNKRLEAAKKRYEEEKAEAERIRKEKIEALKKEFADAQKIADDAKIYNEQAGKTDLEKLQEKFEAEKAILEKNKIDTNELEIKFLNDRNAILLQQQKIEYKLEEDKKNKQLEQEKEYKERLAEITEESNERLESAEKTLSEVKRQALDESLNILNQFAGKNKAVALGILAVQKGLAIADVVVNASKSVAGTTAGTALASANALAQLGPVAGPPVVATIQAAGLKNIAATKISAGVQISTILAAGLSGAKSITGGDSGGGASVGGGSASAGSASPQVGFQNSTENQIANSINNNQETQVIKAVVVGQEVTDQQTADRNAITSNSF